MKNDNALFFLCSLIEYIGRQQKLKRSDVVNGLGEKELRHIYNYADIFHCEPIEKVAYDFITLHKLPTGSFDNVKKCSYDVPDYWDIGEVYERLIEDALGEDVIKTLIEVYNSWIDEVISDFNSDFFYQSRDYIFECYRTGTVIFY